MSKKKLKRVTIKVGTRVLTDNSNKLDKKAVKSLADQISVLMDRGVEVVLVSSGAIGAGLGLLDVEKKGKSLSELQAIASIGQNHLMDVYNEYFNKKGYVTGQILLTQEDLSDRKRFLNIRYTLNTLFKYKAVPIINENDSVSTEEIKFGDNDRLSSLVADLANSDLLIVLTDVDGLYDDKGSVIKEVAAINSSIRAFCKGKGCEESTGGMESKLESVKNATKSGINCVIARGSKKNIIIDIVDNKGTGTIFNAQKTSIKARKRWIAFSLKSKGDIVIDAGAQTALIDKNKSLLPSGVLDATGKFAAGDVVNIVNKKNKIIARGLTNYSLDEMQKIKGLRTDKIEASLGYKDYDEVVHRDNLAVIGEED